MLHPFLLARMMWRMMPAFCRRVPGFLLLGPTILFAQPANELGKPFLQNWKPKDYGAHSQNWNIAQDDRGVIYFGNSSGVLEFDGVSWRLHRFGTISFARSIAYAPDGNLYVGGKGEFGYFAPVNVPVPGRKEQPLFRRHFVPLEAYLKPEDQEFTDVWGIAASSQGVFFQTDQRLFRYTPPADANQPAIAASPPPRHLLYVWKTETEFDGVAALDDRIFVAQRGVGLMEVRGDALVPVPSGAQTIHSLAFIGSFLDRDGRKKTVVATREGDFFEYDSIRCQPLEIEADTYLQETGIRTGQVLPNGTLAVVKNYDHGFSLIDLADGGRVRQVVGQNSGLQDLSVNHLLYDRQGGLWLALDNGVARVEAPAPLTFFDETVGLTGGSLALVRHQNTLYVAKESGVYYLRPAEQPMFRPVSGIKGWTAALLDVPEAGTLLAGNEFGLYQIRGDRAEFLMTFWHHIISLHQSRRDPNRVFIGLRYDGLAAARYVPGLGGRAGSWVNEGKIAGMDEYITEISELEDGSLWLTAKYEPYLIRVSFPERSAATSSDLSRPEIQRFGAAQGLPPGDWISTALIAGQLYAYVRGSVFRFEVQQGVFLPDSSIHAHPDTSKVIEKMVEDSEGNVWFDFNETMNVAWRRKEGSYDTEVTPFLRIDRQAIYTNYPDENGVAWFAGADALIRYDRHVKKDYATDFTTLIRRVTVAADSVIFDGLPVDSTAAVSLLAYTHNSLRVEFAAPTYDNPSANRYQYLLEGFDQDWSVWTAETRKDYTNLPEGDYRFRVRGKNIYGHLGREAVYAFTILPPWWRTGWAYALYGLLFAAAVFAVDRFQRRRLLHKERERASLREKELRAEAAEHLANYLQAEHQRQQAEHQRQTQELEQARRLQLSMLPRTMPAHATVELAAYMKTATEVGGDYYDFDLQADGTLTLVIGDATGHGLPASTMVTATKGVLGVLWRERDLAQVLQTASEAVRRLRLPRLYMALALVRLRGQRLELAGAGMPPALVYRASTGEVETVALKGMPLGSPGRFPYRGQSLTLSAGDTVVLMSDGLPELRSVLGEDLGYERMPALVAEVVGGAPEGVIAGLLGAAKAWCGGKAPDDDMTLIVMRVKTTAASDHQDG